MARRRIITAVVAAGITAAVAVIALAVSSSSSDTHASVDATPNERLTALRTAITPEPTPPPDAVLTSRHEFAGNDVSDGPAIEWSYRFDGTSDQFVDQYRRTLGASGWTEEAAGNLPGQLANFATVVNGRIITIAVFGPGITHDYRVSAFA